MKNKILFILLFSFGLTTGFCQTPSGILELQDSLEIEQLDSMNNSTDSLINELIVVVKIFVDKEGNVFAAEPITDKSHAEFKNLVDKAKEAALTAKFSRVDYPDVKIGYITYKFKLKE